MQTTYKVQGMTCGGCARSVTAAIHRAQPELQVEVDLEGAQVHVQGAHEEATLKQAIEDAGFDFAGRAEAQA